MRLRDEPKSLRTQYQFRNETQIRKNQKVIKSDNDQLVVKKYPKTKQPIQQQHKFNPPNCPSCKQNIWLNFDKGYYSKNCEHIINKQKHQIDKKSSQTRSLFNQLDCLMLIKRSEKLG